MKSNIEKFQELKMLKELKCLYYKNKIGTIVDNVSNNLDKLALVGDVLTIIHSSKNIYEEFSTNKEDNSSE